MIHIGTSGWHYPHWRGLYYPPGLRSSGWLPYYARDFSCVEVNQSFYRLPAERAINKWMDSTGEDFRFAVKASRLMTHMKKLNRCEEALAVFLRRMQGFGRRLGPVLFQLPPNWKPNPRRLADFLDALPPGRRFAFEFRNPAWHTDAVLGLLERKNGAFCQFDLGGFRTGDIVTADFVYLRLHGPHEPYAGSYSMADLHAWAQKIRGWDRGGRDVYAFFDNDQAACAVSDARTLNTLCKTGASG